MSSSAKRWLTSPSVDRTPEETSRMPIDMPRRIVGTSRKWPLTIVKAIQFQ
jgi:hypothetical protein